MDHEHKPNPKKTQAIIIGTPANTNLAHTLNYTPLTFNNVSISFINSVKNLGIHIESDIGWYKKDSAISKKGYGTLHNLREGAYTLPCNIKLMLINALILPLIDYASPILLNIYLTPK